MLHEKETLPSNREQITNKARALYNQRKGIVEKFKKNYYHLDEMLRNIRSRMDDYFFKQTGVRMNNS